jgi:hypothetical protein
MSRPRRSDRRLLQVVDSGVAARRAGPSAGPSPIRTAWTASSPPLGEEETLIAFALAGELSRA